MTTEPSAENVRRQLQLADEALSDARYLLRANRLNAATNRAYYAMYYGAMASLSGFVDNIPRSHRGAISLFGQHYVLTGKLDRQFAADLRNAYDLRLRADYGLFSALDEDQVREATDKAEAFLAEINRLVGEV